MTAALAAAAVVACSGKPQTPTSATANVNANAPTTPPTAPPDAPPTTPPQPPPTPPPPPGQPPPFTPTGQTASVVAVGDIGECGSAAVPLTAKLVERYPESQLLLLGDLAYMQGSMQDYLRCFEPSWGQFRPRWRPAPGNHEYETPGAAGYFQYFGGAAGGPGGQSFYSFRAGDWLVFMLNSSVASSVGSPQYEFVRSELRSNGNHCTMAVWHHPLFTSGPNGANAFMRDMWTLLYQNNADVIVAAHDHLYERFGKQDMDGRSDARGLREFVVGTGGARLYDFQRTAANSQARIKSHGVLRLTLNSGNYVWSFLDTNGGVLDSGSDGCH